MSDNLRFHPGVFVKCPVCHGEVPAEQLGDDPDRPFRCDACKQRASLMMAQLDRNGIKPGGLNETQGKSDGDGPSKPASSGRNAGRNREVQPTADK
jgi:hypothetical protein